MKLYKDKTGINYRNITAQMENLEELAEIVESSNPNSKERKAFLGVDSIAPDDKEHNPSHMMCNYKIGIDSTKKTEKRICRCMYYYNTGNADQRNICKTCDMAWESRENLSNYKILDYEVPMPTVTKNVGGIDLVMQDTRNPEETYAVEVKPEDSNETLARMMAEILTYCEISNYKIVRDNKFIPIKPAICFFEGSNQYEDFFYLRELPALQKILSEIKVFYIECRENSFVIHDGIVKNPFMYREDLNQYLRECGLNDEEANQLSERVRKGKLYEKDYTHPLLSKNITDWFSTVTYLPSKYREEMMTKLKTATPSQKFDMIIKQNLIDSKTSDDTWDSFGYHINEKVYDEYYNNDQFDAFIEEMKIEYPEHYRKYAGDKEAKENKGGVGGELICQKGNYGFMPPKMASVASSSRFCYLALRDGTAALDTYKEFTKEDIEFEKECRIFDSGHAPQLDAYIAGDEMNIYVEVKCHEIFTGHTPTFKNKYWNYFKNDKVFSSVVLAEDENKETFTIPLINFGIGNKDIKTTRFDIKQLVCHLLGIARQNNGRKAKLVYLFFMPISEEPQEQEFINKVFGELENEIDAIFNKGLIPEFCKANNIEVDVIAEESDIMCKLEPKNKIDLLK